MTNNGGAPTSSATVEVAIPSGLTVTSLTPTGWTCTAIDADGNPAFGTVVGPASLRCTSNNDLVRGVARQLDIPVIPSQVSSLTVTAAVSGRLFDGNLPNNDASMRMSATSAPGDIEVTKDDGRTSAAPGDQITYTVTVANPLDFETITGATLTDTLPAGTVFVSASGGGTHSSGVVTWTLPAIAGDTSVTRTVTVQVLPTIATSTITNVARVSAPDPADPGVTLTGTDDDVDAIVTRPAIDLVKASTAPTYAAVGDVITYTFTATNTGDVTLSGVTIADPKPGLSAVTYVWPAAVGVLAPGQVVTAMATYTVTQADIDRTAIDNEATARGTAPNGDPVDDTDTHVLTSTAVPSIDVAKSTASVVTRAGDMVTYTFVATNDGPLTLTGVSLDDPLPGLSAITYTWPGAVGVLAPGESVTATATYLARQADVDAGRITNTVTAVGRTTAGVSVDDEATAVIDIVATPAIDLDKTGAYADGTTGQVGDRLNYTFTVTNSGNVTLTGVEITDPLPGLSGLTYVWPGAVGVLTPGQVATATADYVVTQADIDSLAGVTNRATATGDAPDGTPVDAEDEVTMPTPATSGIQISKTGVLDATVPRPGDLIRYSFAVTNLGDVTLTDVTVEDLLPGLSGLTYTWPGPDGELGSRAVLRVTATYPVTQADIDRGSVANTATTSGLPPAGGAQVSDEDSVTVVLPGVSALTLEKTGQVAEWIVGGEVSYAFVVVNTGNLTETGVTISDSLPGLSDIVYVWPADAGVLAPGERATATATYPLTTADVDARSRANTATVTSVRGATATDDVILTAPPLAGPPGASLAYTGAVVSGVGGVAGLLLSAGLLLLALPRRRTS